MWRTKLEAGEGGIRPEEVDEMKKRMNAKVAEVEHQLEAALSKNSGLEKAKNRMISEMEDLVIDVERVRDNHDLRIKCIFHDLEIQKMFS